MSHQGWHIDEYGILNYEDRSESTMIVFEPQLDAVPSSYDALSIEIVEGSSSCQERCRTYVPMEHFIEFLSRNGYDVTKKTV
jgi:hypothetical protein